MLKTSPFPIVLAGLLLCLALPTAAAAVPAPVPAPATPAAAAPAVAGAWTVAVIDDQRLVEASEPGKKELARLQKLGDQRKAELDGIQAEISKLEDKRKLMGTSATDEELIKLGRQIEDKRNEGQRRLEDTKLEFQDQEQKVLQMISKMADPVVKDLVKERAIKLILRTSAPGIAFFDPSVDITGEIIVRLNALSGASAVPAKGK